MPAEHKMSGRILSAWRVEAGPAAGRIMMGRKKPNG